MDVVINDIAAKWRECLSEAAALSRTDDFKAKAVIYHFSDVFAQICEQISQMDKYGDNFQYFEASPVIKKISEELIKVIDEDTGREF